MRRAYDEKYRFLSTPSARRATCRPALPCCCAWNFYPRPPRGGRHSSIGIKRGSRLFLSTPSARRATPSTTLPKSNTRNFYPRPPRGGRPRPRRRRCWRRSNFYPRPPRGGRRYSDVPLDDHVRISIHALREEGDLRAFASTLGALRISIHALREEGDPTSISGPTLHQVISIHALREEGDRNSYMFTRFLRDFYPRPPRGGRPHDVVFVGECNFISIHALREEGDSS